MEPKLTAEVLRWFREQKPYIVPIPSTTKADRLKENFGSVNVELTAEEIVSLTEAANSIELIGNRYPDELEAWTGL